MAQKRPSYPSIRARQRHLLEYIGSTGRTERQVARDFGVKPQQLRRFTSTKSTEIRKNFGRSPAYEKLYSQGTTKELRQKARSHGERVTFRPVREYTEPSIQQFRKTPGYSQEFVTRYVQTGEQIQHLYASQITPQYLWAIYTKEQNIPVSIKSINLLRRNGKISAADYNDIVTVWKDIYNIQ